MENKSNKTKVEVSKIVIRIGEKEATLSLEEVKALQDVLDNLLGDKPQITYVPWITYPQITTNPNPYWTITTTNTDNITYITSCPAPNGISIY